MKLLTLNTWQKRGPWKERWKITIEGVKQIAPDVIFFQELFDAAWAEEFKKISGYKYMHFYHEESGLVIYSKIPFSSKIGHILKHKSHTEDYRRFFTGACLQIEGCEILVCHTHLSWKLNESSVRQKQVEEILSLIEIESSGRPVFLTGDFNSTDDSLEIKRVTDAGFDDAYKTLHPEDPGLTWDNLNPFVQQASHELPDRRIDYIFFRGVEVNRLVNCKRVFTIPEGGVFASDHYGVLAKFNLRSL